MLYEIECDQFISYGQPRGRIKFNPGLNTVRGGKQSDNSIGKSTFLLAVDFCFGGDTYYLKTGVREQVPNHIIKFAFKFDGIIYYFTRSIVAPEKVCKCNSNYETLSTISLDEFKGFLFKSYKISLTGITFRDIVGRYARIYGKDNYSELKPLHSVSDEKPKKAIDAFEKLFAIYDQLGSYKDEVEAQEKKRKAFDDAKKADVYPVAIPSATQVKENEKKITELRAQLKALVGAEDIEITEQEQANKEQVLELRSQVTLLKRRRGKLQSQLRTVKINAEGCTKITEEDLSALKDFFPEVDLVRLEAVINFHQQMQNILSDELQDEINRLELLIKMASSEIKQLEDKQRELGIPVKVSSQFLQKHSEIEQQIGNLLAQNKAYKSSRQIATAATTAKKNLYEVELNLLTQLADTINAQMVRYNDVIYNATRLAPVLEFYKGTKGGMQYNFRTPNDGGMGTGYKSMIVLDLSVLKLSELPTITHDSLMFNHIGYEPLEKLMGLYLDCGKQVFIAYDKQNAPTKTIQKILDDTTIIHLSEDGNELFGFSWAKRTSKPEDLIETAEPTEEA